MENNWSFNEVDRKAAEPLLAFLPDRLFDAHAHLYRVADLHVTGKNNVEDGPEEASLAVWREQLSPVVGGGPRLRGGLFFPLPLPTVDVRQANEYVFSQLEQDESARGLVLVTPADSPEPLDSFLRHPQMAGFKVYHVFSTEQPTWQSSIAGFCPDWMWQEANDRQWIVMLHLVKDLAVADEHNIREIRQLCTRYPRMKLVLAHAARCFHAPHAGKGIERLRGLENVWFDTSAICEAEALKVILQQFGPRKLLWGSDFPVSQMRGKAVTAGDGFVWLDADFCRWDRAAHLARPMLVGIESLRALKQAADDMGLNEDDVNDICYGNAVRLLELEPQPGTRTAELYRHAKQRIPGGVQLLSKRPENMAPDRWPAYFREARGCEVWDMDGRHYYDMSTNGVGSCLLGYRDPDVTRAVVRRAQLGSMCSLNAPEEVELADLLCGIHPWAEQVRFVRGGGEACAVAVRIARATTDRSVVAICGYHGWHDWYVAANLGESDVLRGHLLPGLEPLGVPRELRGTAVTFKYNDLAAFEDIIGQYGDRLAAVIVEPCRHGDPQPGFLQHIRAETSRRGIVLIFDEVSVGWRLHYGGAHLKFGVAPDIAVFAKAMGNGHPVGAVIGTGAAMQGAHASFMSSTYWSESIGPAAALATIRKLGGTDAPAQVERAGRRVLDSWRRHGDECRLPVRTDGGYPCLAHFRFQHEDAEKLRTLYTRKMLERGFLAGTSMYVTLAHHDDIIALYDAAIGDVFGEIADSLRTDTVDEQLQGKVALSGFQRLV